MKTRTRLFSLFLATIMLLSVFTGIEITAQASTWNGKAASSFAGGNGTKSKPYLISNGQQLARMRNLVNSKDYETYSKYRSAYYKLTGNIALNDTSNYANWASSAPSNSWAPIGTRSGFYGNFDGAGYTISGLYIKSKSSDYIGLFSENNGVIKNVKISKSYVAGNDYVGALVGRSYGTTDDKVTVANCSVSSTTVAGCDASDDDSSMVGGIIGYINGYISVYKCTSSATVTGNSSVGGIAGELTCRSGSVYSNKNTGKIKATGSYTGGVVGYLTINESSSVKFYGCSNTGSVTSGGSYVGGIAGYMNDYSTAISITKLINKGTIKSDANYAGGLFGKIYKSNCNMSIRLSYNTADVSGSQDVGGLFGSISNQNGGNINISNCSNDGSNVTAEYYVGGISGDLTSYKNKDNTNITNCINKAYLNCGVNNAGQLVGAIYNYDYDGETSSISLKNNIGLNSISSANYRGTFVGYAYNETSNQTIEIVNNRYKYSTGNIYATAAKSAVTASSNSSLTDANAKSESYLANLGFYTCTWNIPGDEYPTVNTNGTHTYTVDSVTKANSTKKTNGKVVRHCSVCGTSGNYTIYYGKTIVFTGECGIYNSYMPSITVKDSTGSVMSKSNYSVSYKNLSTGKTGTPKAIGEYKVTVKMKGNYTGSISKTLYVRPANTYISKISKPAKKQIKVQYNKVEGVTGYQVQYSTSSSFSGAKSVYVTKTTATIKNLSSGKVYYVRVRPYKTVKINGKSVKIYSKYYSSSKSIKTS